MRELFSSSLSAIKMVSSAYLSLVIILLAILILACDSSSPAFRMMYSVEVYLSGLPRTALQYAFLNFELVHCSVSGSNCCFLTCIQASQEADKVV